MDPNTPAARVVRFGVFELDAASGELRRHGLKIRLPEQSFQILRLLLSRPWEVVTRDELRRALWSSDTFVDFDVGLNSAIRKLREALDDSAENPRFVETLPRRGYRFIAPVNLPAGDRPAVDGTTRSRPFARIGWVGGGALLIAAIVALGIDHERSGLPRRRVAPEAYDAYLKGQRAAGLQRYDGFRTAVSYFEQAVAKQPDFAAAHEALAQAQMQFLFGGPLSPRETIPKAEAAVRRALELDDTLAQAHRTLGQILTHYYWKWDEGEKEFQRAAALSGPSDGSFGAPGLALMSTGRSAEAVARAELALKRDPLSFAARMNLGTAYRAAGRHERAISEFRRALEITPGHSRAYFQLGATYVTMGRIDDAIRELETAVQSAQGGNTRFEAYLGYAYAVSNRFDQAREILAKLASSRQRQYVSSFGIALIHDALSEKEQALVALERAFDDHAVEFAQMTQYPAFRVIAAEPRFQAVMRSIGLPR